MQHAQAFAISKVIVGSGPKGSFPDSHILGDTLFWKSCVSTAANENSNRPKDNHVLHLTLHFRWLMSSMETVFHSLSKSSSVTLGGSDYRSVPCNYLTIK